MKFSYLCRIFGIYFAIFFIISGALVLGIFVVPIFLLFSNNQDKYLLSRKIISKCVKFYLNLLEFFQLIKIEKNDLFKYVHREPFIFIANHYSLFDILFFIANIPNCSCIVKHSLAKLSPYCFLIYWANYIVNKGDGLVVNEAVSEITKGNSIVIFPEGTRMQAQDQIENVFSKRPFQRGAASISLKSDTPIVPVKITYSPPVLGKNFTWKHMPNSVCSINILVGEAMTPPRGQEIGILSRVFTSMLEDCYVCNTKNDFNGGYE